MRKVEELYDFLIIGGGFAGLSSAYHLAKDGYSVAVLERTNSKDNASFNSTAMICHDPDVDWQHVIKTFGTEGAKSLWDLSELGMKLLGEYSHAEKPSFITRRTPAYIFANSAKKSKELQAQYELYKSANIPSTYIESGSDLLSTFHSVLKIEQDGMTNNQAMLRTLTQRIRKMGGTVLHKHPVSTISYTSDAVEATANGKIFRGTQAIIATGNQTLFPHLPKTETHRTFVVGYENRKIPKLFKNSILWDNEDPYHYIRSFKGNTVWVGGEDIAEVDYNPNKDYYEDIEQFAKKHLLFDESYKRTAAWSGTFYPTKTGLPYIGSVANTPLFFNLGFSGTGVVMSFVSGYLLASWLKGKELKYKPLFAVDGK